ncbi:hypothetical protein [Pyruvatibacter mobilis]|uniref:hypothetical protein n=1 Tax=Pyruvatibacter mobilis TaxID=1712261 RepID=UPI003D0F8606
MTTQSQSAAPPAATTTTSDPAANDNQTAMIFHMPGLDDERQAEQGGTAATPGAPVQPQPALLDKASFFELFRGLWAVPNLAMGMMGEAPLRSLDVDASDPAARAASDALYDTIQDTPALHWLLRPESEWLQRVVVIGAFAGPRVIGARNEWTARQAAKARAAQPKRDPAPAPHPANDNPSAGPGRVVTATEIGNEKGGAE